MRKHHNPLPEQTPPKVHDRLEPGEARSTHVRQVPLKHGTDACRISHGVLFVVGGKLARRAAQRRL